MSASFNHADFHSTTQNYTDRLTTAVEEMTAFASGDTAELVTDIRTMVFDVIDNPAQAKKNLLRMVDAYPGGALGLAASALTVLQVLAAKRSDAKAAKKAKLTVADVTDVGRFARRMSVIDEQGHPCDAAGCSRTVAYDDEPYCFDHSADSGSTVVGYSHRRNVVVAEAKKVVISELNDLRGMQHDLRTEGVSQAIGFLMDAEGMLRRNNADDLESVMALLDSMTASPSLPAQQSAAVVRDAIMGY